MLECDGGEIMRKMNLIMSSLRIIFDHIKEKGGGVIYLATSEKN
jgi:hypothetical protein